MRRFWISAWILFWTVTGFSQPGSGLVETRELRLTSGSPIVELTPGAQGVLYARSEAGEVWRSNDDGRTWAALPMLRALKAQSLAAASDSLFLVAVPRGAAGLGAVLRSSDGGHSFKQTDLALQGGLADELGPRLASDPNRPALMLLATPLNGLWRSADSGAHWERVSSFPALPLNGVGLTFVVNDSTSRRPGQATPVILVGVADPVANLLRSNDGGQTWAPVPGGPTGMFPNHAALSAEGVLYLSYGDAPGPEMAHGAVWSYNPRSRQWHDLTPPAASGMGFNALALDMRKRGTLFAAASGRPGGAIFETIDGGAHWTGLTLHPMPRHGIGALLVSPSSSPSRLLYSAFP